MPNDSWLKLYTDLPLSRRYSSLPSNTHRLAYIHLLMLNQRGLLGVWSDAQIAAWCHCKSEREWLTVKGWLIKAGLMTDDWEMYNHEDKQLSPGALRQRRYRARQKASQGDVTNDVDAEADADAEEEEEEEEEQSPHPDAGRQVGFVGGGIGVALKGGGTKIIPRAEIEEWKKRYPQIDVEVELGKFSAWCFANKAKRKTERGLNRAIVSWMNRVKTPKPTRPGYKEYQPGELQEALDEYRRELAEKAERG